MKFTLEVDAVEVTMKSISVKGFTKTEGKRGAYNIIAFPSNWPIPHAGDEISVEVTL